VTIPPNDLCPCSSGSKYKRCCRPLHQGVPAETPEALMRSRFSAYAAGLVDYVIDSTDPRGPQWKQDRAAWSREIGSFCRGTVFEGLEILDSREEGDGGRVRFHAKLRQGGGDASFLEDSTFVKSEGRWLYSSGQTS
jgi:SEC-C motif-containing protein